MRSDDNRLRKRKGNKGGGNVVSGNTGPGDLYRGKHRDVGGANASWHEEKREKKKETR